MGYIPDPRSCSNVVPTAMLEISVSTIDGSEKTRMRRTGAETSACLMVTNCDWCALSKVHYMDLEISAAIGATTLA